MVTDIVPTCEVCGNPFTGHQLQFSKKKHVRFCSHACRVVGHKGAGHPRWLHGGKRTPEYMTWNRIKQRCRNDFNASYYKYGARGIDVCDEWYDSFQAFISYVGPRPSPKHQIGRINNDGNYEPGNVRWETPTEQARNRRSTRLIFVNGVGRTAPEWEETSGVKARTIRARIKRRWSGSELLAPVSNAL